LEDRAVPGSRVRLAHATRGSGPWLTLIAGTGYPMATWPPDLLDSLTERYTLLTFDHRGTGGSPSTADAYSTRQFAADVLALLDELAIESCHLLGHSMGGRVAQWVALDGPDRVRSLVLAASGPGQVDPSRPQAQGVPVPTALALIERGYEGFIRETITRTFFPPEFVAAEPDRVDWLINAFWSSRPAIEDYLKHVAARQEHRTASRLVDIRQPALVVVGDADTHRGGTGSHLEQSQFLARRLPNARLELIEGERHGFLWTQPARLAALIGDWIDAVEAGGAGAT
jgi:pimeloyl-ACP methyl ester carboxylesterase